MEFIEFLLHFLKDPLAVLSEFLDTYDKLTYAILFLIVFVETGLVIMPLLPGDSLLFAIGLLSSTTGKLDMLIIIPLLVLAALMGDNVNYFVGNKFGTFIKSKDRILFLKKEYILSTEAFFAKRGGIAVILARFMPIVRTIAPFVAGAGSMEYRKYITYCITGAIIWVSSISSLGFFLGSNEWVKANFEKVVLTIVFLSIAPLLWGGLKALFSNKATA
jgi:membrane-associated protein